MDWIKSAESVLQDGTNASKIRMIDMLRLGIKEVCALHKERDELRERNDTQAKSIRLYRKTNDELRDKIEWLEKQIEETPTLRDEFAKEAMTMIVDQFYVKTSSGALQSVQVEGVAKTAYAIADAMLTERGK